MGNIMVEHGRAELSGMDEGNIHQMTKPNVGTMAG